MKTAFLVCLGAAMCAGCIANSSDSGSNNGSSPSGGPAVVPADAAVAAGDTQQYRFETDQQNVDVVWKVDGVAGGNATLGRISSSGVYTAPMLPPPGGDVTITAVARKEASLTDSTSAAFRYSDASLSGAYVFVWRGRQGNGSLGVIGRFEANGHGDIEAGRKDINASNGSRLDVPVSGSYDIAPNGTGQAVIAGAQARAELRFVLGPGGRARVVRVDNGAPAVGVILPQSAVDDLAGDYVFRVGDANAQTAVVGRFTMAASGDVGDGIEDRNQGGLAVRRGVRIGGAYERFDNGHGALSLTTASGQTRRYTFYVASSDELLLLRVDAGRALTGRILPQADMAFTQDALAGDYAFYLAGNNAANTVTSAGLFSADGNGNIDDGVLDVRQGQATRRQRALTGAYDIADNGRGVGRLFRPQGQTDVAFYMQSPDHALLISIDQASTRSGEFIAQAGGDFAEATLDGPYTLSTNPGDSPMVGRVVLNGKGGITDGVKTGAGTAAMGQTALGGSYALEKTGRGELLLRAQGGGEQRYTIYLVSPERVLLLGVDAASVPFAQLYRQWPEEG